MSVTTLRRVLWSALAALAVLALTIPGCATPPAPVRPDILVIDIDSMRADRLGLVRGGESVTPTLDGLAAEGTRFSQAITQGGWTNPALAALLSGRHPDGGGMQEAVWLSSEYRSLAEILSLYDYRTAVFWGNTMGAAFNEFNRGFSDVYSWTSEERMPDHTGDFFSWIDKWRDAEEREPFFAFVHTLDLHSPLPALSPEQAHRFARQTPRCSRELVWSDRRDELVDQLAPAALVPHLIAHYDAALYSYDRELERIFQRLKDEDLWGNTVVVLISDHGEEFDEHSFMEHGLLYDTVLRIPLVIRVPGGAPRAVSGPVQTIDLAPTLLELAGVPIDAKMEGRSLVPLMAGQTRPEEPVLSLTRPGLLSVRTSTDKFIRCRANTCGGGPRSSRAHLSFELYDLVTDPGERINIFAAESERAEPLMQVMRDHHRARMADPTRQFSAEQRRELKERGYWNIVGGNESAPPVSAPKRPKGEDGRRRAPR